MSSFERPISSSEALPHTQEKSLNRQELIEQLEYPKQVIGELYKHFLHYGLTQELLEEHGLDLTFFQYIETINKIDVKQVRDEKFLKNLKDYVELIFEKALPLIKKVIPAYDKRVERLFKESDEAERERQDEELLELLSREIFSQKDRAHLRKRLEQLKTGKIIKSAATKVGTNGALRCEIATEEGSLEAFVKENHKEAALELRQETVEGKKGGWCVYRQVFDGATQTVDWKKDGIFNVINDSEGEKIKDTVRCLTSDGLSEAVRTHLGKEMGISPDQVLYDNATTTGRMGVLPGEMMDRERINFCLSVFLGFRDLVPVTTVRPGPGGHDLASVQEKAESGDPLYPAREITELELYDLFERPPEEWAQIFPAVDSEVEPDDEEPLRSITYAGAFAYLMGDLDGMNTNLLFSPAKKQVKKIDNGASLGVLTGETIAFKLPKVIGSPRLIDQTRIDLVRSAPLEIVLKHKLRIDTRLQDHLRGLYERITSTDTKEKRYLLSMFRMTFRRYGEVIARNRMDQFLSRLKNLVDNGYPKGLEEGKDYMPELKYDFASYKNQQGAKQQEKAA